MRRASRVKRCNGRCTAVTDAVSHFNLFSRRWKLGSLIVAIHCLVPLGCRTFLDFLPSLFFGSSLVLAGHIPQHLAVSLLQDIFYGALFVCLAVHARVSCAIVYVALGYRGCNKPYISYACFKLSSVVGCGNTLVTMCKSLSWHRFATNYCCNNI